jgi:Peptidase family M48
MRYRCGILRSSALLAQLTFLVSLTPATLAAERANVPTIEAKLQSLVSELQSRLLITPAVVVSIVPSNPLMMSVEAPTDPKKAFLLTVDATFLDTLSDDELEAAIAHELGHVYIFTHHPFLQTEELANQIAMRAVSRESLERVYVKVSSQRGGAKGDLGRFLGSVPKAALAPDNQSR